MINMFFSFTKCLVLTEPIIRPKPWWLLSGEPTQVAAELSQHAVWVGGGHLCEAGQDQDVAVLQRALVHRLGRQRRRRFDFGPFLETQGK